MTLRENIEKMQEIAYKADRDFTTARTEFATAVASQQQELLALATKLDATKISPVINTFSGDTISLFQDKFRVVDTAFDSVIESGKLDEATFSALGLDKIGIRNTNMRTEYESTEITWPLPVTEETALTVLCKLSRPWVEWADEYKVKACNEDNLAFLKHTDGGIYPVWANFYGEYFRLEKDIDASSYEEVGNVLHEIDPVYEYIWYTEEPESPTYRTNDVIVRVKNIYMTGCTWKSYTPTINPITIGPFYRCYANFGETLFDFTNLLNGTFGSKPITTGLDNKLTLRSCTSRDQGAVSSMIEWFDKEAAEYATPTKIITKLTNARALEQATSLYAAKFAILKIMYGHIRRATKR